jgi:hypothetical protein
MKISELRKIIKEEIEKRDNSNSNESMTQEKDWQYAVEIFDRADALIDTRLEKVLQDSISSLRDDGFDDKDILSYFKIKIKSLFY